MIYFVTDRTLCSMSHYLKVIEQSCEAGVEAIILREKDLNDEELLILAKEISNLVRGTNTKLIINSNIEVAKEIKAEGVHLSYKDFVTYKGIGLGEDRYTKVHGYGKQVDKVSTQTISKMKPQKKMYDGSIGVSIHSVEEGIVAYENGAHYIMYGHVFESSCKKGVQPRGLEKISDLEKLVKIPIVAIGGINKDNFREALNAGADKIAIRSGILQCTDVFHYLGEFVNV